MNPASRRGALVVAIASSVSALACGAPNGGNASTPDRSREGLVDASSVDASAGEEAAGRTTDGGARDRGAREGGGADTASFGDRIAAIQARIGGRIGVHSHDTGSNKRVSFDADARYAMASTFKLLLAGAVLAKADKKELELDSSLKFGPRDMIDHAPVTSLHLAKGSIRIRDLCAGAVEVSDNPAANLLLARIGGPAALNAFLRTIGDKTTRLDRTEPTLNENLPDDPRDTTTPRAMVDTTEALLLGEVLGPDSRAQLTDWLVSANTGLKRIRAGLPKGFRAGDKTGTGANGAVNDVAIVWPPGRKPILLAIYLSESTKDVETLSAAHAEITREALSALGY